MKIKYEMTDLYQGESNYNWVKRGEIILEKEISKDALIRLVKKELNISSCGCRKNNFGSMIALYPKDSATVVFINTEY